MDKLIVFTIFLISQLGFSISCRPNSNKMEEIAQKDSIPRPPIVSPKGILMNFGGGEIPVYAWAEYIGSLKCDNSIFPHIIGVKYYYPTSGKTDIMFYENMQYRKGLSKFKIDSSTILPSYSSSKLLFKFRSDTIVFFPVLEDSSLTETYKGLKYSRINTVKNSFENVFEYSGDVAISIVLEKGDYFVRFNRKNEDIFKYKMCPQCDGTLGKISFLNKTNGNIYFIEKNCYIEPVDRKKVLSEAYWK
jgi:hypothetical protein